MKTCYLCGVGLIKNSNKSKDHVPPDCVFPPGEKPDNLITIQCCRNCNEKYRALDEKMRNYVAILADENSGKAGDSARRAILKSYRLSSEFLAHTKGHPTLVASAGEPRRVFFFSQEELELWSGRIVKGLYFRRTGTRINEKTKYQVDALPEMVPPSSMDFPLEEGLKHRPYFTYVIIHDADVDNWFLVFYDRLVIRVVVEGVGP